VPLERIVPVGNAAGVGARELLCSAARRREARALAGRIEHVELASVPQAELRFAAATMFSEEAMEAYLARCGVRRRG